MSVQEQSDDRPCLHCLMVELIDDYFSEYPVEGGDSDMIDTNEVLTAIAKMVAELACKQDGTGRQQMIEKLMVEIMDHDAEYRLEDAAGAAVSAARH